MIYKNIEFHNVDELTPLDDGSMLMHRAPLSVEKHLMKQDGNTQNMRGVGVELRFVMKSDKVKLRFKVISGEPILPVSIFCGDLVYSTNNYVTHDVTEFEIDFSGNPTQYGKPAYNYFNPRFDLSVIRVVLDNDRSVVAFCGIDGEVEVPTANLLPSKKMLAYGSSITSGVGAIRFEDGYSARTAYKLGVDIICKGYPGSCCIQHEMADYLAQQEFDFALFELGVNILDIPVKEFGELVTYFLNTIAPKHKDKKLFLISPFFMFDDLEPEKPAALFRREFVRVVNELKYPNVVYIDGLTLLGSPQYLMVDCIHPDPIGHEIIANRLTEIIKDYIK